MSEETPGTARPVRMFTRDRFSRTALVGLAAVLGLTILGVVGTVAGKLTGSDLVALGGTFAAILGTVAGRSSSPGSST
jgi:hypothetical protein